MPFRITRALTVFGAVLALLLLALHEQAPRAVALALSVLSLSLAALSGFAGQRGWQRERQLAEQGQRLQAVIDAIPVPVFYKDEQGRYLGCNHAFGEFLGRPVAEIVGRSVFELSPPDLARRYHAADAELFKARGVQVYEAQVQGPTRREVVFYKATFDRPDGSLGGLVGTILDITERKLAEARLRESELRLGSLIEALPDAVFFKDGEGRWLVTNSTAQSLFRLQGREWFGLTDRELAERYPDMREAFECCVASDEAAWRAGCAAQAVESVHMEDGRTRHFEVTKVPLQGSDGQRSGLVIIGHDITARLLREEALRVRERAIHASLQGIVICDARRADRPAIFVSRGFETITGYSAEDVLGRNLRLLQGPETDAGAVQEIRSALAEERKCRVVLRNYRKDGSIFWNELHVAPVRDEAGQVSHFVGIQVDVTERRRAEDSLRLAATVFDNTAEGVSITNGKGEFISVNAAFTRITGYTLEEVRGRNARMLQSGRHDGAYYQRMWQSIREHGHWQGEIWNRRKNGELYPQWLTISEVRDEAAGSGAVSNYVAVFSDITQIKNAQSQLERLAHFDALTGLPNRILLSDRLRHALDRARRGGRTVAVLLLDLDGFKNVNDSLGHPAGDRLLQVIGTRLQDCLRQEDTVARLGGDEFAVVLEDLQRGEQASDVAEKLIQAVARPVDLDGHGARVSVSIGIAIYPRDGEDGTLLMKAADTAMYESKQAGRNTYNFHHGDMSAAARRRMELEHGLQRALDQGEFELVYQPQVALDGGAVIGAEALLRWRDPQRGMVSPAEFIPLAEETGLILPIGEWVLREACRRARAWEAAGLPFGRVSVNVAAPQIERGDFELLVRDVLQAVGLAPCRLELEITESFLLRNAENARRVVAALEAMGVSVAIDDFGTGYSSLAYLKHLPVHKLKIDRGFVHALPGDEEDAAITRAVINLGKSLGFQVIAEGVESAEAAEFLRAEGCDYAQGYLFARPLAEADWIAWLQARLPAGRVKSAEPV